MNNAFEGIKTVYLDFDGTLHDTIRIYGDALRKGYDFLVQEGYKENRHISDEEAQRWLGWNADEMWENFAPEAPEDVTLKASRMVGEHMHQLLLEGHGRLYPHAKEVLEELKSRGYTLVYLSNCKVAYKDAVTTAYGLAPYFTDQICSESFNHIPKQDIIKQIRHKYPEKQLVVGDRFHDMMAAKHNDLPAIFCQYGFGEEEEGASAQARIDDIRKLLDFLP